MNKLFFSDEFEMDVDGQTFYIEAEVEKIFDEEENEFIKIKHMCISDEYGDDIDDTHDAYDEIVEEIKYREYEVHDNDNDFGLYEINGFLKEEL